MQKLKSIILFPLLLVGLIIGVYHNVIHNGISGLDDLLMIEENWDRLTNLSHIYTAFTDDVFSKELGTYYRPVQILTYMPDAFIANSPDPVWYIFFLINIILFATAILLLYGFLKELGFSPYFRLIFSALFAIHPVLTPAVAWVPGRVDIVLFIFVIIAIWSFLKFFKSKKTIWLAFHFLFFAIGMFTKETTIVVPVISILFMFYYANYWGTHINWSWLNFIEFSFWKDLVLETLSWLKKHLHIFTGWLLIVIFWYILRTNALPDEPSSILGLLTKLAMSWQELIVMFGVILVPFNLQVFLDLSWPYIFMAIPGFILFFVIPRVIKTQYKDAVFGVFWIFLFLLPTTLSDYLNYHRLMIPMVGIAFLLRPMDFPPTKKFRNSIIAFAAGLAFIFMYENTQFQKAFVNRTSFWQNAIEYSPNSPFANNGLAWSYHLDHKNDSALIYYQRVVDLRPDRENVRMGMALIYEEQGNTNKADSFLQAEFTATNDSASVFFYIGQIELERNDTDKAILNLIKGYPVTDRSRNARLYYDTLDVEIKSLMLLEY